MLGVVATVPVFEQALGAVGNTGGGVVVGVFSVVVAGFALAFGLGIVLGVAVVVDDGVEQFVVLICVSPGEASPHCFVSELLFGLDVTDDSGLVTAGAV